MTPLDLPDGRPPLAKEFGEAQLMHRIAKLLGERGGKLSVVFVPGLAADGFAPDRDAYWSVGAEYGQEAEDSPMAGAAIYGTGATLRLALEQAGDDARLWRSDAKLAKEVEAEAHGG